MEEPHLHKLFIGEGKSADKKIYDEAEKAVFAYPIKHYTYWQKEPAYETMTMGGMGEDFAVLEMDEFTVFIGDTYKVGDAMLRVFQPWEPSQQFQMEYLALEMKNTGRTGWYFQVLQEGEIQADSPIELMERPYPQWSIQAANEVMHFYKDDLLLADELASCELLAANWRSRLKKRLRGG